MLCPKCGKQLPDWSIFCSKCGYKIITRSEEKSIPQSFKIKGDKEFRRNEIIKEENDQTSTKKDITLVKNTKYSYTKIIEIIAVYIIIVMISAVSGFYMGYNSNRESSNYFFNDDNNNTTIDPSIEIKFSSPSIEMFTRGSITTWDAVLNIISIFPSTERILWSEMKVSIKAASGSILLQSITPAADIGIYNDGSGGIVTLEVWYVEATSGDVKATAGDGLKITGMSTQYEGASIQITKAGILLASISLPTNFP